MKYALPLLLVSSLALASADTGPSATPESYRTPPEPPFAQLEPPGPLPSARRADTYPKNPAIDALNYAFALTLSDETDMISGEATIDLRFLEAGIEQVRLDLIEQKPDGTGMRVRAVTGADGPLEFDHRDDALFIALARPTAAGERRRITVAYEGTPATGLIIGPNKHGDRTFFSDNWPNKARNWLPTIDHPLRQGDERTHRHGAGPLPGHLQRAAHRGDGPPRRHPPLALEAVGPDRDLAVRPRRGPLRRTDGGLLQRRADPDVGLRAGPRRRLP